MAQHGRHETVALTLDVCHISGARLSVAERLAKLYDTDPKTAFLHDCIPPDSGIKFSFANHFASAFDENDEYVESSVSEFNRDALSLKKPCRRMQSERTKRDLMVVRHCFGLRHEGSLPFLVRSAVAMRQDDEREGLELSVIVHAVLSDYSPDLAEGLGGRLDVAFLRAETTFDLASEVVDH